MASVIILVLIRKMFLEEIKAKYKLYFRILEITKMYFRMLANMAQTTTQTAKAK